MCDVKLMCMILKLKLFRKIVEYHVISKTKKKLKTVVEYEVI